MNSTKAHCKRAWHQIWHYQACYILARTFKKPWFRKFWPAHKLALWNFQMDSCTRETVFSEKTWKLNSTKTHCKRAWHQILHYQAYYVLARAFKKRFFGIFLSAHKWDTSLQQSAKYARKKIFWILFYQVTLTRICSEMYTFSISKEITELSCALDETQISHFLKI